MILNIVAISIIYCLINISWIGLILVVALVLNPVHPRISMMVTISMAALLLIGKVTFYFKLFEWIINKDKKKKVV